MPNNTPRPRILIVDDEAAFCQSVARAFAERFDVVCATSLEAMLDRVEAESFDAVVLDFMMPDANGVEALWLLQGQRPDLAGRVVMLAGCDAESATLLFEHLTVPVLSKPCALPALQHAILDAANGWDVQI